MQENTTVRQDIENMSLTKFNNTITGRDGKTYSVLSEESMNMFEEICTDSLSAMRGVSKDSSESDKNQAFALIKSLINKAMEKNGGLLNYCGYTFVLHRDDYNYLLKLIRTRFEYNNETIFFGLQLEPFVTKAKENSSEFKDENTSIPIEMNIIEISSLLDLTNKVTEKGLSKDARTFAELLTAMAPPVRAYNYWKNRFQEVQNAYNYWIQTVDSESNITLNTLDPMYKLIYGESAPVTTTSTDTVKKTTGNKKGKKTEE